MSCPVKYRRVSSKFTYKRWHPVLKRYRAHLGIDYAANIGTPIRAAGDGKIIYRGWKSGYGKTVEVRHGNGYKTLYAHMSRYSGGQRSGKYVKKGTVIGYVGSTGISTGPHLHFGLYKNNRAINPNSVVKITKGKLSGTEKKQFLTHVEGYKEKFKVALAERRSPIKEKSFDYVASLDDKEKVEVNN